MLCKPRHPTNAIQAKNKRLGQETPAVTSRLNHETCGTPAAVCSADSVLSSVGDEHETHSFFRGPHTKEKMQHNMSRPATGSNESQLSLRIPNPARRNPCSFERTQTVYCTPSIQFQPIAPNPLFLWSTSTLKCRAGLTGSARATSVFHLPNPAPTEPPTESHEALLYPEVLQCRH